MSLGGYKFAGYKCTKPENATDAEWALLIHKTRLKAFMAANTLAGDIWEFDWSNGAGELLTFGDGDSLGNNSTYLFYNRGINLARVYAHHITYTEAEQPQPATLEAYFTNQGSAGTSDTSIRTTDYPYLYDASGVGIPYDSSKTYTVIEVRQYNGTVLTVLKSYSSISGDSSGLYFHQIDGRYNVYAVTYKVS